MLCSEDNPPPPWVLLALQASPSQRVTLGRFEDKQVRGAVHAVFKAWPSLATETAADNAIVLGLGGGKGIKRRRSDWAGGAARYLKFTLSKENMESQVGRGGGIVPEGVHARRRAAGGVHAGQHPRLILQALPL